MKEKCMSILAQCEKCKEKFEVNGSILKNGEFNVNGQSIFLTYYDCPHCSKRHFVQIDDIKSKQMLVKVGVQFATLAAEKKKGKIIPQKKTDKFKKSRQNLSDYRMALMRKFTGKLVHDGETGIDFELRFSV